MFLHPVAQFIEFQHACHQQHTGIYLCQFIPGKYKQFIQRNFFQYCVQQSFQHQRYYLHRRI
jgi:hypothetical protein